MSWGASYTGPGTGDTTNDLDGDFNPPFANALPSSDDKAVLFTGAATAPSTRNDLDYAATLVAATFTNNSGQSGTVATTPTPASSSTWGRIKQLYR